MPITEFLVAVYIIIRMERAMAEFTDKNEELKEK